MSIASWSLWNLHIFFSHNNYYSPVQQFNSSSSSLGFLSLWDTAFYSLWTFDLCLAMFANNKTFRFYRLIKLSGSISISSCSLGNLHISYYSIKGARYIITMDKDSSNELLTKNLDQL